MKTIRQGDLLFIPIPADQAQATLERAKPRTSGIVQEGEATGHHHRVAVLEDAEVLEVWNGLYVRVGPNGVSIMHEEHGPVRLEPNTTYTVHRAREFDYLTELATRVRD